jgi:hypothetical protein
VTELEATPSNLLGKLTEDLELMFYTALDQAPGGLEEGWTDALAQYGVPAIDPDTREDLLGRLDLVRGALPDEVAAVAQVIVARFVAFTRDPRYIAAAREIGKAIEFIYFAHATTRPKSMFAHAVASANHHESAKRLPSGVVHRCARCEGPRLVEQQACPFCGA